MQHYVCQSMCAGSRRLKVNLLHAKDRNLKTTIYVLSLKVFEFTKHSNNRAVAVHWH